PLAQVYTVNHKSLIINFIVHTQLLLLLSLIWSSHISQPQLNYNADPSPASADEIAGVFIFGLVSMS
ncbi:hypothetical protein, partial [Pseudoflavonifractor phocaeensis]|uniref:hypothetical protein n=1 Tax=Pseudoflavonifractor phocaeensis TaxID=1870988 RepID=UPI001956E2C3